MAKHIDKLDDDKSRGVGTFPVRVGEAFARRVDQFAVLMIYVVVAYLVFVPRYFTPILLIIFFAFKHAWNTVKILNAPKPAEAPEGWEGWPVWFSAYTFFHNRQFGGLLVLALILDALLRVFLPGFWPAL